MTDLPMQTDPDTANAELRARYGIMCVPADRFDDTFYRCTSLADAVAHAKRDAVSQTRRDVASS